MLIFYPNGHVISYNIYNENSKAGIDNLFKKLQNTSKSFDWYKVDSNSLLIEYFADNKNEMITSVYFQRGKINADSTLELKFDDTPERIHYYKFVKSDNVPKIENDGLYLNKKWYKSNIHSTRK